MKYNLSYLKASGLIVSLYISLVLFTLLKLIKYTLSIILMINYIINSNKRLTLIY